MLDFFKYGGEFFKERLAAYADRGMPQDLPDALSNRRALFVMDTLAEAGVEISWAERSDTYMLHVSIFAPTDYDIYLPLE